MDSLDDMNIVTNPDDLFAGGPTVDTDGNDDNDVNQDVVSTDPDDLFDGPTVEDDDKDDDITKSDDNSSKKKDKSDNDNDVSPYSELTKALYEEGVFTNVDSEEIEKVKDVESFKALIQAEVDKRFSESESSIKHALEIGVEPQEVQLYNNAMQYLNSINEDILTGDDQQSQQARVNIIYRDYLNKGLSEKKASQLAMTSAKAGTDIEDAREALDNCKQYYTDRYKSFVRQAEEEESERMEDLQKQANELRKNMLEKETLFDGITIDKATRQRAYNNMTKIVATGEDGEKLTAVQKYADDNPVEFRTAIGLLYTLTDGFKHFDKILNKAVNKKVNSKLDDITRKLTNQRSSGEDSMRYKNGGGIEDLLADGWKPLI